VNEIEKITPQNAVLLLQFFVPGFLVAYFRSVFVTRREASLKDNILLFVLVSVLYAFVTAPLWLALRRIELAPFLQWLVWFVTLVAVPVATGVLLGLGVQNGWIVTALARIGLRPLSPYRTGWDWVFGQRKPFFVLVTMEDGSQVAGWFGYGSLAASDLSHHDLYIEKTYDLDEHGNWHERARPQGILIAGKHIKYVEFMPSDPGANDGR